MTGLDDIYSTRLLELAGQITRTERLKNPDASVSLTARPCGSKIELDLKMANGQVAGYGHSIKACLLGQSAASVMAREIAGSTPEELRTVARQMRAMLRENGPPPSGRWADLASLEAVRDYKARFASTLLVFDAVEKALDEIEAKSFELEGYKT